MKKVLIMFGFVLLALSMQVEAATMALDNGNPADAITVQKNSNSAFIDEHTLTLSSASATGFQFDISLIDNSLGGMPGLKLDLWNADLTALLETITSPGGSSLWLSLGTYKLIVSATSVIGSLPEQYTIQGNISSVPVPAAIWLFGSALMGLIGFSRRKSGSAVVAV
jgi:hypothetical protein